ncbi:Holliday junction ATP-dependent DNA helicase RuvB [Gossypium australe]|uniref:Holliday junction ATP-dependent DNA helicase RuvB n=1 Tax=Gossypium australe TaxID=47621 RepID=A0A5B6V8Q7_9ROSI|nr:Holliday junction ATP-dependent DNA helicase RuvB [Gossypium australe]
MGCVASKLEEEEEVVSICRERKRLIKLAVDRRYALAEAHFRYCQALYAVSAAIKLFVARHSSPPSPFLITFPPPCPPTPPATDQNVITNPMLLQQRPSESTHEAIACESCGSSTSSDISDEETEPEVVREEQQQQQKQQHQHQHQHQHQPPPPCGYFYMQMPPPMPSPQRDFGWDFFNPFDVVRPEIISGYNRCSDDDLRAVREQEGIPELEEEGDTKEEEKKVVLVEEKDTKREQEESESGLLKVKEETDVSQREQKGLTVIDSPEKGRELLEALKDIEDYFIRAYDSGKDVSRMLEANMVHLQSGLEGIKENSTKLIQAITWHRSTLSKPQSCKSLVASSSKSSSAWTEYKNDLFDQYGGMDSGSHSLTLERLYAWEKKLYEEVKAGDSTRKIYERKCSRLRNQDVKGYDELTMDKTRAAVKDLYARILIAIRSAESISKRIQNLRDEELLPQLIELLKGLTRTWKVMLESHESQNKILSEVKTFACPSYGKFCNDSHRLATLQLEAELQNWHACFTEYVAAQRAYIQALHGWLTKFLVPEVEFYSRGRSSGAPYGANGPPLLVICYNWLTSMDELPDKAVTFSLKSFSKDVKALWAQQGEEQQQKRKVDGMAKELDRRTMAFQKAETRFLESKLTEYKSEMETEQQNEYLTEKKDQLEMMRKRIDVEREKHHNHMQETQRITLNGLQTGFSTVFESLIEFSKASMKIYSDIVTLSEKMGNVSYIEGSSQVEENSSR